MTHIGLNSDLMHSNSTFPSAFLEGIICILRLDFWVMRVNMGIKDGEAKSHQDILNFIQREVG